MQDLLFETVALQRIVLFSKLVAAGKCTNDEKDVALVWLGELTLELQRQIDMYENKEAPVTGRFSGGGLQ